MLRLGSYVVILEVIYWGAARCGVVWCLAYGVTVV